MHTLIPQALTPEAFAPYGEVIDSRDRDYFLINGGRCRRYHRLASVELVDGGRPVISIFRTEPVRLPLRLTLVERHPLGSQAFVPLHRQPYLVVVAPPGEPPAPRSLRAFWVRGGEGVNYRAGTWHHPLLALEPGGDFLVVDREGPGANCDELPLDEVWLREA